MDFHEIWPLPLHRASQRVRTQRLVKKVGEVAMSSDIESPLPVRWIAESEEGIVGAVDRTPRGKYRATNNNGRKVGTYRTLTEARVQLAQKYDATRGQRLDQSRFLVIAGLVALIATMAVAIAGIISLLVL